MWKLILILPTLLALELAWFAWELRDGGVMDPSEEPGTS